MHRINIYLNYTKLNRTNSRATTSTHPILNPTNQLGWSCLTLFFISVLVQNETVLKTLIVFEFNKVHIGTLTGRRSHRQQHLSTVETDYGRNGTIKKNSTGFSLYPAWKKACRDFVSKWFNYSNWIKIQSKSIFLDRGRDAPRAELCDEPDLSPCRGQCRFLAISWNGESEFMMVLKWEKK